MSEEQTPEYVPVAEGKTNQPEGAVVESAEEVEASGDPSVPTELLDLHVQLEEAGVTPEDFKEVYGAEAGDESAVGGTETPPPDGQGA